MFKKQPTFDAVMETFTKASNGLLELIDRNRVRLDDIDIQQKELMDEKAELISTNIRSENAIKSIMKIVEGE